MNIRFHAGLLLLALAASAARAETRMQVSAPSTPIFVQASATSRQIGAAQAGEILFVARTENGWAAVAPPGHIDLWLNKDFIEGNRVIAKSIQVRSGPGIQYEVVGTLERGAPVMPRGEEGDWCKIEPPSSMVVWVKTADLAEIKPQTTPIREVATVAAPAPAPVAPPPPAVSPAPEPIAAPVPAPPAPAPEPIAKIAPSRPGATPPPPAPPPAPAPVSAGAPPAPPSPAPPPAAPRGGLLAGRDGPGRRARGGARLPRHRWGLPHDAGPPRPPLAADRPPRDRGGGGADPDRADLGED